MKKILWFCVLIFIFLLTSCNSIRYKIIEGRGEKIEQEYFLDDASKLEIKNVTVQKQGTMAGATVMIYPASERKVILSAPESIVSRLNSKISFKTLKIYGVKNEAYVCDEILISIYGYTFEEIQLSNSCNAIMEEGCLKEGNLKVDLSGGSNLSVPMLTGQTVDVDLSGASSLNTNECTGKEQIKLDLSGASKITVKNCQTKKLRLDSSGASTCIIEASQLENAIMDLSGAATTILNGSCSILKLDCSGASTASLQKLVCNQIDASVSGASHATLTFKNELTGSVSGGANIIYYGNASNVDVHQSGGATLIAG